MHPFEKQMLTVVRQKQIGTNAAETVRLPHKK